MDESKLKQDAPKLFGLEKKNIHHVPKGFFDELEGDIRERIMAKTTTRLFRIERWCELSAAAAIIAVVFISGSKIFPGKPDMTDTNSSTIYSVPGDENNYYPVF